MTDPAWPSPEYHGMDNLRGVEIPPTAIPKSVFEERDLYRRQRDEAWIEVAQCHEEITKLKSMLAHFPMPPHTEDAYPHPAMPERGE